ncbi:hypothetical protein V6N12_010387 [Hibiscus sabdariffa]|uniref:Uncharacterized protein n=1 Tax=Hibiscus sabdariffa TaxID=183260 RepID=A0ABR2EJX7_9ROSI
MNIKKLKCQRFGGGGIVTAIIIVVLIILIVTKDDVEASSSLGRGWLGRRVCSCRWVGRQVLKKGLVMEAESHMEYASQMRPPQHWRSSGFPPFLQLRQKEWRGSWQQQIVRVGQLTPVETWH